MWRHRYIYIGKENYLQAKSLLNTLCSEAEIHSAQEDPHQYHITHGKITYELHPVAGFSAVSFHQKKYEDWASQQLNPSNCDFATLNLQDHQSYKIRVPNHQFNIPYLFDHLCRHLRFQGVGVRQFIDIVLLLHQANQDVTFQNTLKQDLQLLGIFRAWQIHSGIFVYNLGLPPSECPFFNPRKAQKSQTNLLQAILTDSNFGFQTTWRHQEELHAYNAQRVLTCYRQQFQILSLNYPLFPLFSLYEFLRQTTRTLFITCGLKRSGNK